MLKNIRFGYWINRPLRGGGPIDALEQAIAAEKCGFDSVWLGDHFMLYAGEFSETFTLLTAAGLKTDKAMLCSAVTDSFRRHPATLAQIISSIDRLTKGRAALGIGAGEALNLIPFGIMSEKPLTRLKEAITVIKKLWASSRENPCNFDGEFFSLKRAFITVRPYRTEAPPIYVGALREKARRLVGEIGDGYFPWINSPETYKKCIAEIEESANHFRRHLSDIDKVAVVILSLSKDFDLALSSVSSFARTALVVEREVLKYYGCLQPVEREVSIQSSLFTVDEQNLIGEMAKRVPLDLVEKISAIGKTANCINKLQQFIDAGADHLVILDYSPDPTESLSAMKKEILPYFTNQMPC